jgi:NCS1 family nucleobase:cation symporter-1
VRIGHTAERQRAVRYERRRRAVHDQADPRLGAPRSAINLADYYLVRRGRYDVRVLFSSVGRNRDVNWRTMLAFLAGLAAEVPFADSLYPAFEGPVATAWNGLDISWLVGFVVAGGLYWLARPDRRARRDAPVTRLNRSL